MSAHVATNEARRYEVRRDEVDQLADVIAVSSARIDAATHELLTQIRRFDELKGWVLQGATSCAKWLSWRIGSSLGAAGEKVRVARALGELPRIDAAFAAGELSYCKVRAMTRVASAATEELLLTMARSATGADLERICRGFRRVQRTVARDEADEKRFAARFVRRRHMPDGMVRIDMQLLPDEAELVWQALEQVRGELRDEMRGLEQGEEHGRAEGQDGLGGREGVGNEQGGSETEAPGDLSAERSVALSDSTAEEDQDLCGPIDLGFVEPVSRSDDGVIDASDPLAHLFAPEPAQPRGYWTHDDESGELTYVGSDPPDVWPEEDLSAESSSAPPLPSVERGDVPGLVDAMVTLAERKLSQGAAEVSGNGDEPAHRLRRGGERALLLVHLGEDRLAALGGVDEAHARPQIDGQEPRAPFCAELHDGTLLEGESLLRLACDCSISVVKTDAEGAPLDVGRQRRTIPPALMRALLVRDGGCRFPGCCASAWVEAHHVKHWAQGGGTNLDNTALLCRFHHRAVHEEGFSVARLEDGSLCFRDPGGRVIELAPAAACAAACAGEGSALAALEEEALGRGVVIDRRTSLPAWDGTRPDFGMAVQGLWGRQERGLASRAPAIPS